MAKRKAKRSVSRKTVRRQKKMSFWDKYRIWIIVIIIALLGILFINTSTGRFVDTDGDGLPNNLEEIFGSDPGNPDTDGDGCLDGDEYNIYYTDVLVPDCTP